MAETLTLYTATGFDASQTNVKGYKLVVDVAGTITTATKNSNATDMVTAEIRASDHSTVLSTASIAGSVCTFNVHVAAGTYYLVHNASSKRQCYKNSGVSYPLNGTNISATAGWSSVDGEQSNVAWNFDDVSFSPDVNVTVTPTALSLTLSLLAPTVTIGVDASDLPSVFNLTLSLLNPSYPETLNPFSRIHSTGGPQSAAITNDDAYTYVEPNNGYLDYMTTDYAHTKDPRSF